MNFAAGPPRFRSVLVSYGLPESTTGNRRGPHLRAQRHREHCTHGLLRYSSPAAHTLAKSNTIAGASQR